MKIAVPVAEGRLCMHFGHCETFAIVEVDEANREVAGVSSHTPPPHEPGVLPKWLSEQGVNLVIAGGMGQRAQALFMNAGVDVVVGAPAGEPEELVRAYLSGTLESGANFCDH